MIRRSIRRGRNILGRLHEWGSIRFNQKPRSMMLLFIILLNVVILLLSAWIISAVALPGNTHMGFFTAVYNTITMILDAGRIESIIQNPGNTNLFLIIFCLVVIVISMITFTGSLIGYVTNVISNLINSANNSSVALKISDHFVILGWNNRASEIINDLLFCPEPQKVVVLADSSREEIITEIRERLADTIAHENRELAASVPDAPWFCKKLWYRRRRLKNNLTIIVREGDIFSSVQLNNIQLEKARSIIILGGSLRGNNPAARNESEQELTEKDDNRTVKTLMQVVDITSRSTSNDDQKIVVEVENNWTGALVRKIINAKQKLGKCRVVPFQVHNVMGQLLSQFSLMPELNLVYRELFSNKGASFYAVQQQKPADPLQFVDSCLAHHRRAVPLTFITDHQTETDYCYYMAENSRDISVQSDVSAGSCELELQRDYWLSEKYVLILGSNSKMDNIMRSFKAFCLEWSDEAHPSMVHITIVDEEEKLKRYGYYQDYPFVEQCVPARINEEETISRAICDFISAHPHNASLLILSDDTVDTGDIDAKTMTYLIYARESFSRIKAARSGAAPDLDIVAEIIDPRHVDIIRSYDVHNVVISNRYISKMITQLSEDYELFNFYSDIMTYDVEESTDHEGREIYIKKAGDYFSVLPPENTPVGDLVRTVYQKSLGFWGSSKDFAVLLGYVDQEDRMHFFCGDEADRTVSLKSGDRLVLFSNH